jgi:hypothetical protein
MNPWMWVDPGAATANTHGADIPIRDYTLVSSDANRAATTVRLGPKEGPTFDPYPPWTTAVYENWHFRRYVEFLNDRHVTDSSKNELLGTTSRTRFFLTEGSSTSPQETRLIGEAQVHLISYDGSRLVADVRSEGSGDLVFADNWDHGWAAVVNGHPAIVHRDFGTFKSVAIPRGTSTVEMTYCPFDDPLYRWLC